MNAMVERAAKAIFETETDCEVGVHKDEDFHVSARAALLAALDPEDEKLAALINAEAASYSLPGKAILAALRRVVEREFTGTAQPERDI